MPTAFGMAPMSANALAKSSFIGLLSNRDEGMLAGGLVVTDTSALAVAVIG
jgi:hypothetical protein